MGHGAPPVCPRWVPACTRKRPGEGGSGQMSLKERTWVFPGFGWPRGISLGLEPSHRSTCPALSRGCPGELEGRKLKQFLELSGPGERQWRVWDSAPGTTRLEARSCHLLLHFVVLSFLTCQMG